MDGGIARLARKSGSNLIPWPLPEQLEFFVDRLRKDMAEMREQKRAFNTRRAYAADWRDFQTFCARIERDSLPALPETVMLYLTWMAGQGKAIATIARRLTAITVQHRLNGIETPCTADVGVVLADIRRRIGAAGRPKTPITPAELRSMLATTSTVTPQGIRNRAILLIGFASAMRRGELAGLDLEDVSSEPTGLLIRIWRSKTDQDGRGREVGVGHGQFAETCPVRALAAWTSFRGDWPGPLFCRLALHSGAITRRRLAPSAIAAVVKDAASRAGMERDQYAGHSLRSGCATAASVNGADILSIARRLGHRSVRTTERYVRHANVLAMDPLKGVL